MVVMFFSFSPRHQGSYLRRDRYISTAESCMYVAAVGRVGRLATAWVRMRDNKYGSVGVGWDGCTQSTRPRRVTGYETESSHHSSRKENKRGKKGGGDSLTSAGTENSTSKARKRQKKALTCDLFAGTDSDERVPVCTDGCQRAN